MVLDRFDRCIPRPARVYPKLPAELRLPRWFEKVADNSAFMRSSKTETRLKLPRSLASDLKLASPVVIIVQKGDALHLTSAERESPLATLSAT